MVTTLSLMGIAWASSASTSLLMIGNSYTSRNSLHSLTAEALEAGGIETSSEALTSGGLTFATHADYASTEGHEWNDVLVQNENTWSWVVLQEQSQTPGFPQTTSDWSASLAGATVLDGLVAGQGGETVFFMTWGRRDGDPTNSIYPDFSTMQDLLEEGYLTYVELLSTEDRPVWVAPAGLAFAHIHDEILALGEDPLASGSLFSRLYSDDGSHPSLEGSYLTACVLYATLTGASPVGLSGGQAVDNETRAALQAAAEATVFEQTPHIAYPWQSSETPTDTGAVGEEDSGATDDTAAAPDTGEPAETGAGEVGAQQEANDTEDSACGCTTQAAPQVGWLVLMVLGLTRRRTPQRDGVAAQTPSPPGGSDRP